MAALVGFIDGIVMMAGRMVTDCPGGTFFPLGTTDFNCYTHPHGAEGLAISAISLSLGALSLLAYCIAVATSKDRMASPSV